MSSINIEEFTKISKKQAEDQAELYAKRREVERDEDLKKFSELIEKCVDTKISSALAPVIEKHNELENKTSKAIGDLSQEIASLKQMVEIRNLTESQIKSTPAPPVAPSAHPWPLPPWASIPAQLSRPPDAAVCSGSIIEQRFEAGRLTLGFEPIDWKDLRRVGRMNDIEDKDYVLKLAVAEYLRMEMNIKTVDSSNIVKAFTQPNKTDEECLRIYAQFDNMNSVNTIWQHVNRLGTKPDNHVMIYVPSTHQEQFAHLNTLGYPYRKPTNRFGKMFNPSKVRCQQPLPAVQTHKQQSLDHCQCSQPPPT